MTLTQDKLYGILRTVIAFFLGWVLTTIHWTLDADTLAKVVEVVTGFAGTALWSWLSKSHLPYIDTPK